MTSRDTKKAGVEVPLTEGVACGFRKWPRIFEVELGYKKGGLGVPYCPLKASKIPTIHVVDQPHLAMHSGKCSGWDFEARDNVGQF